MFLKKIQTTTPLLFIIITITMINNLIFGQNSIKYSLIITITLSFIIYFFSHKILLWMYDKEKNETYNNLTETLAKKLNLNTPKLYIINQTAPNSLTIGTNQNNSCIILTKGLIQLCDQKELETIITHELCKIKSGDIHLHSIIGTIAGTITFFGGKLVNMIRKDTNKTPIIIQIPLLILAVFASTFTHLFIYSSRIYKYDICTIKITNKTKEFINVLEKIEREIKYRSIKKLIYGTEHMFFINPINEPIIAYILSTHPSTNKRIKQLKKD
jgi:heat shock protein HtpX